MSMTSQERLALQSVLDSVNSLKGLPNVSGGPFLPVNGSLPMTGPLGINQGTITTAVPALNLTSTWNDAAVTFDGSLVDVTNTASGVNSRLFRGSVNGVERFSVTRDGVLSLRTSAVNESGVLGAELLSAGGWTATGWTGTNPFTHTVGNVNVLSNTFAAVVSTYYQIAYTITGRTAGTVTIALGGQSIAGVSATGAFGPRATTTGTFTVTPTTDFDGVVTLSVKSISEYARSFELDDSTGAPMLEVRSSLGSRNNQFVGVGSGRLNTTGYENTFSGFAAGNSNTTGYQNVFSGYAAGYANTTGNTNVFSGRSAGYLNTTGYQNVFSGFAAGYFNTTGYQNTSSGTLAGYANTTGYQNVFSGYAAGYANTTGYQNVFSGSSAGRFHADGTTALTTAVNSVYLGANTKGLNNSDSNSIVIGFNAIGLGANTAVLGNSSITATQLRGEVTVPTLKLGNARVAGTPATDGYVLITDLTGTVYRVPTLAHF